MLDSNLSSKTDPDGKHVKTWTLDLWGKACFSDCQTQPEDLCSRSLDLIVYLQHAPEEVPVGSPSRGGDVAVYVFGINQPSLPAPFYSVLVSISVFMALLTVFHSTNSPENSPLSHSVLPVLFLPYWSFQPYISLQKSPSALI